LETCEYKDEQEPTHPPIASYPSTSALAFLRVLCSGQSNMQFYMCSSAPGAPGGVLNASAECDRANDYPLIRLFQVGQSTHSGTPLDEFAGIMLPWVRASNESVASFSAVCFLTMRYVFDALGGTVPVGLVNSVWGGTMIELWESPDALAVCKNGATAATTAGVASALGDGIYGNSVCFNAMIHPLIVGPMALRIGLWYRELQPSPLLSLFQHLTLSTHRPPPADRGRELDRKCALSLPSPDANLGLARQVRRDLNLWRRADRSVLGLSQ
jgi:hypothetical protein